MAEEVKEQEDGAEGEKLVAFKLLQKFGENPAGSVVYVPEAAGDQLVKSGLAELAKAEDMDKEGVEDADNEEEYDEAPVMNTVQRVIAKEKRKAEDEAAQKLAKTMHQRKSVSMPGLPAQPKSPVFPSVGHYVKAIIASKVYGDSAAELKAREHEKSIAEKWEKLGIQTKSPSGINEASQAQGGYLANPEFSDDIYVVPHSQINLQELCEIREAKSNVFNQRFVNESSLANGSIFGGLNMVATAEGAVLNSSLPAWSNLAFTLQKFGVFVYYTSEILQDASYPIESEINEYVGKTFLYGINTQIVQGATIEGLLNSPALVTVTSSANDTAFRTTPSTNLTYADVANIWSSVYPDSQASPKGIWLFHPSLLNPLSQMTYTFNGTTPAWSLNYTAADGLEGVGAMTPYRLFSKPAYASWACSAPGTAGDIMYVDFATVKAYVKPFRIEVSREFHFSQDEIAVRFIARIDAKTKFRNKITGPSGTEAFSAVVTRSGNGSLS